MLRRAGVVAIIGVVVCAALLPAIPWSLAIVLGWDATAIAFLAAVWLIVLRADAETTRRLAAREDESHRSATILLLSASLTSLFGVGVVLRQAGDSSGGGRLLLIVVAVATVLLSWNVVNTVYVLRYAHLQYTVEPEGISFGDAGGEGGGERASYRDFAYLAYTIGMTYQVSDTAIRDPMIRRAVLTHGIVSYVFGVVIVGGAINIIAGLVR